MMGYFKQKASKLLAMAFALCTIGGISHAAPYAAVVMDARNGEILHSRSADRKLHPASLTKMMTLYIAFEAIERGEISADKMVNISANAASEPPSKLGLRKGSKIKLRYLLRAAAVKSANDAATAIGEAISGSESAFIKRMNLTARAMGMRNTTFKNAHGLTAKGHISTARDMTILGRHVLYDYPEYYNLFSRVKAYAGIKNVHNTNRRLLNAYRGADGIKTGYTNAAGFNLVASAKRGNERVITTVFGGRSTRTRNARVAELLDMGFARAPSYAALRKPAKPRYTTGAAASVMVADLSTSIRPKARPAPVIAAQQADIQNAVLLATLEAETLEAQTIEVSESATEFTPMRPKLRPATMLAQARPEEVPSTAPETEPETQLAALIDPSIAVMSFAAAPEEPLKVVSRLSDTDKTWGIRMGIYPTHHQASMVLMRVALAESATLQSAERVIRGASQGYEAIFTELTNDHAELSCARLQAQNYSCTLVPQS